MPRFTPANTADALEIQQLILDWGLDLDETGGEGLTDLITADCDYRVAGKPYPGHEAVRGFYAARNDRVRAQQKDGVRTQRHTITNQRVLFDGADAATVTFIIVNYSSEGKAPALNLVGPTIIADVRMGVRREADGEWRISAFDSAPVFIGNDPFLNASVVPK